jgi:hypothetical protein
MKAFFDSLQQLNPMKSSLDYFRNFFSYNYELDDNRSEYSPEVYSIDVTKIENYINSFTQSEIIETVKTSLDHTLHTEGHYFAGLISIINNIRLPSLKKLHEDLSEGNTFTLSDRKLNFENLLSSLQVVEKLPSLIQYPDKNQIETKFKAEFILQFDSPSKELEAFLKEIAELPATKRQISSVIASSILDLVSNLEPEILIDNLNKRLINYKDNIEHQLIADVERDGIYTYCNGQSLKFTKITEFREWALKNQLSEEQIYLAFIWADQAGVQGFSTDIGALSHSEKNNLGPLSTSGKFKEAAVLIEITNDNRVILTHQLRYIEIGKLSEGPDENLYAEIFRADITELKNTIYIPGLGSKSLNYEILIMSLNPWFKINIPKEILKPALDLEKFLSIYTANMTMSIATPNDHIERQDCNSPVISSHLRKNVTEEEFQEVSLDDDKEIVFSNMLEKNDIFHLRENVKISGDDSTCGNDFIELYQVL